MVQAVVYSRDHEFHVRSEHSLAGNSPWKVYRRDGSIIGKLKTIAQMVSIALLLYQAPILGISAAKVGEILFYIAGGLTIWSMFAYLKAAWPSLVGDSNESSN